MATLQAGVYYDHPGWYRLVCRYDPWMQENLKASIGLGNYKYDPKLKLWYVREPYRKTTVDLLTSHGYTVSFEGKEENKKEQKSGPKNVSSEKKDNPWSVIFGRLPDTNHGQELRVKLYREVTKILHPDKGGHEELMKELNEAWSKLKP
jgi:hypothetical protein